MVCTAVMVYIHHQTVHAYSKRDLARWGMLTKVLYILLLTIHICMCNSISSITAYLKTELDMTVRGGMLSWQQIEIIVYYICII